MKKMVFIILALVLIIPAQWASAETPQKGGNLTLCVGCLLYTSDAADDQWRV